MFRATGALRTSADPGSCRGCGTVPVTRVGRIPAQVGVGHHDPRRAFRPTAMTGVPARQPPGPNSLHRRGVSNRRGGGRSFLCRAIVISGAAPGTTCGNHRANYPRHLRASSGMIFAVQMHEPTRKAGRNPYLIPPYKRGVTGSNPVAPTEFLQLGGLFETLIGDPVTTGGNHWCMLLTEEECPAAVAVSPSTTRARRAPTAGTTGTGAARRAEGSAASGLADACLHRGEPDGWRAP